MNNLSLYSLNIKNVDDKTELLTAINNKLDKNSTAANAFKVNNLTVETAVPPNAKFTDTIYTHPSNHPATMITQDSNNRFVSDVEKASWNSKANLSDVYTKAEVYNKSETDNRIQSVIGAAPTALDTLKEISDALNNDPSFAATMTANLSKKVDKISGKGLSTEDYTTTEKNKLAGIDPNANNYTHPSTHPATMITQDANNRFVTDSEKMSWNAKADSSNVYTKLETDMRIQAIVGAAPAALDTLKEIGDALNNDPSFAATVTNNLFKKVDKVEGKGLSTEDYTTAEKTKLAGLSNYTHPVGHPASMITQDANYRFVTDAERATWNNKLNLSGGTLTGTLTTRSIAMQNGYTLTHNGNTIIDSTGNVWRAVYNDLAEWFERGSNENLEPGDVLVWNGTGVEKSKQIADKRVVGVYSDTYGICLGGDNLKNMQENICNFVPIGISGRVKVKVTGPVNIGDILTTSDIPGVAAVGTFLPGTIVGKALEPHEGTEVDRIWILIMNI